MFGTNRSLPDPLVGIHRTSPRYHAVRVVKAFAICLPLTRSGCEIGNAVSRAIVQTRVKADCVFRSNYRWKVICTRLVDIILLDIEEKLENIIVAATVVVVVAAAAIAGTTIARFGWRVHDGCTCRLSVVVLFGSGRNCHTRHNPKGQEQKQAQPNESFFGRRTVVLTGTTQFDSRHPISLTYRKLTLMVVVVVFRSSSISSVGRTTRRRIFVGMSAGCYHGCLDPQVAVLGIRNVK